MTGLEFSYDQAPNKMKSAVRKERDRTRHGTETRAQTERDTHRDRRRGATARCPDTQVMALFLLSTSVGNLFTMVVNAAITRPDGSSRMSNVDYYKFFVFMMWCGVVSTPA